MKTYIKSFIMALSMFTIIPMPFIEWDEKSSKNMMKLYPMVGAVIGIIYAAFYSLMTLLKCPIALESAVLLIIPFILSGMIHLDGYCDVCDAILSRRNKEEKLRILKDSRIGAFAVAALFMLFFMQYGALSSVLQKQTFISVESHNLVQYFTINCTALFKTNSIIYMFILIPIVSRSLAGYFLLSRVTIKESTLGAYFKKGTNKSDRLIMALIVLLCILLTVLYERLLYVTVIAVMIICAYICTNKCIKEFGGVSGDVAGFILVVCECSAFVTLALL